MEWFERSFAWGTEKTCGWTIGWWNDVNRSVSEKRKLWKEWKLGKTSKEKQIEAKRNTKKAVYQAKCEAERNWFVGLRDDDKMIKSVEEGRVDMVTDLINRILLQSYCY